MIRRSSLLEGGRRPVELEELGRRIQARRSERSVTLDVMAERTGFSKGYLSRIENGKKTPPLETLARIARALGTDVNSLLSEHRPATEGTAPFIAVVRAGQRTRIVRNGSAFGYAYESLSDVNVPKHMQPFLVRFPAEVDKHVFFEYDGEEFLYVLSGRVEMQVGHERHVLETGDAVYMDTRIPHRGRALDGEAMALLVVYKPPRALGQATVQPPGTTQQ